MTTARSRAARCSGLCCCRWGPPACAQPTQDGRLVRSVYYYNKLNAEAEKIKADANKTNADANKTNADAEKIRFQSKNLYSEELRKQLSYIQTVDNKAKISGPEQQLWKDVAAEAKNNLHNFVTQQPADGENPAETD